jgi:RimJ/RimL family protein N-acetyltransferase
MKRFSRQKGTALALSDRIVTYLFAPERYQADDFILRSYDVGDGKRLSDANNESYEHLRPWMAWASSHQSVEDAEKLVRQFRARYLLCEDFVLGVFSPDETRLLGGAGFHLREGPLSTASAEIGLFIRASEAGRGLGTRVVASLLHWGFTEWPWLRLSWRCDVANKASMRVAEKAGLRREGVLRGQHALVGEGRRDTACYGLTQWEWLGHPRD